jgi:hypothetical protein
MVLLKWATGDVITEDSANKRGIRKGTEAEIASINVSNRETGDFFFNSTNGELGMPQIQLNATSDKRSNIHMLLGADETVTSITGATPTQVKDISFNKDSLGFSGNQIAVVARIKQTGGGTTSLIMEVDGLAPDEITLTETSTSYVVNSGTYDASGLSAGHHTLRFFLSNSGGTSGQLELLEVFGL